MKYFFPPRIWVLSLVCLATGWSCSLQEEPTSLIFTDSFYKTPQDAEAALNAVYGPMAELYAGPAALLVSDFSADQSYPRSVVGRNTLTLFSYEATYSTQKSFGRAYEGPQGIWQNCYRGIENANWVLAKVPTTRMDDARRNVILGEAYFLRAFYHWMLTKNFGEIVVKTKNSESQENAIVGKSSRAEVYRQIYNDLDQAVATLPAYSGGLRKGSPSKEAALALYAKASLYNEDWAQALQKAQAALSGGHVLMNNVLDVYDVNQEDAARVENMWAFEGERQTPGRWGYAMGLTGPRNSSGPEYGKSTFGSWFAYQFFFDSFDPKDQRRQLLDTTFKDLTGKTIPQKDITPITPRAVLIRKYRDPNSVGDANNVNVPILRVADVYLIAAEAEARQNGPTGLAYQYLNAVRKRAGLENLAEGLDKEAFIEAVLQERSWELFAEGDRWYDLTRTGQFLTVIPTAVNDVYPVRTVQPKNKYFPIPQDEIQANPKLTQNPDWQ